MAKRKFTLHIESPGELAAHGWPSKTAEEAYWFSASIKPWLALFQIRHGKLAQLTSQDAGDDPPDIIADFQRKSLGFELTKLLPERIAHFDAVVEEVRGEGAVTNAASISMPEFETHEDMQSYAVLTANADFQPVTRQISLWRKEAARMFKRKVDKARKTPFDYLIFLADESYMSKWDAEAIVADLHECLQHGSDWFPSVIFLLWTNPCEHVSWHIGKNESILSKAVTTASY